MIEREFEATKGAETVGFSHCDFGLVVQTLDNSTGKQLLRSHGHFDTLLAGTEVGVPVDKPRKRWQRFRIVISSMARKWRRRIFTIRRSRPVSRGIEKRWATDRSSLLSGKRLEAGGGTFVGAGSIRRTVVLTAVRISRSVSGASRSTATAWRRESRSPWGR